jgi:hypothetical protein
MYSLEMFSRYLYAVPDPRMCLFMDCIFDFRNFDNINELLLNVKDMINLKSYS